MPIVSRLTFPAWQILTQSFGPLCRFQFVPLMLLDRYVVEVVDQLPQILMMPFRRCTLPLHKSEVIQRQKIKVKIAESMYNTVAVVLLNNSLLTLSQSCMERIFIDVCQKY